MMYGITVLDNFACSIFIISNYSVAIFFISTGCFFWHFGRCLQCNYSNRGHPPKLSTNLINKNYCVRKYCSINFVNGNFPYSARNA